MTVSQSMYTWCQHALVGFKDTLGSHLQDMTLPVCKEGVWGNCNHLCPRGPLERKGIDLLDVRKALRFPCEDCHESVSRIDLLFVSLLGICCPLSSMTGTWKAPALGVCMQTGSISVS